MSKYRVKIVIMILAFLLLLSVSALSFYLVSMNQQLNVVSAGVSYTINSGDTLNSVAYDLAKKGYIENAKLLILYSKLTNTGDKLFVGTFKLTPDIRVKELISVFTADAVNHSITVPEGLWLTEIAERLNKIEDGLGDLYLVEVTKNIAKYQEMYPQLGIPDSSMEGYLFPDTYNLMPNPTAESIVVLQLNRFVGTCYSEWDKKKNDNGLTFYENLVLASLIEGEAKVDEERDEISSVYINRINTAGWRLDCDATLIYAKGERVTRVLNADKSINSPYNTYKVKGLPPTPINNPGLKSFTAALYPANTDYYFYFAKGDGSHVFAHTLSEHNANIKKYRN